MSFVRVASGCSVVVLLLSYLLCLWNLMCLLVLSPSLVGSVLLLRGSVLLGLLVVLGMGLLVSLLLVHPSRLMMVRSWYLTTGSCCLAVLLCLRSSASARLLLGWVIRYSSVLTVVVPYWFLLLSGSAVPGGWFRLGRWPYCGLVFYILIYCYAWLFEVYGVVPTVPPGWYPDRYPLWW